MQFRSPSPKRIRPSGTGSRTSRAKQQAELERRREFDRLSREVDAMELNDIPDQERQRWRNEYWKYLDALIQ